MSTSTEFNTTAYIPSVAVPFFISQVNNGPHFRTLTNHWNHGFKCVIKSERSMDDMKAQQAAISVFMHDVYRWTQYIPASIDATGKNSYSDSVADYEKIRDCYFEKKRLCEKFEREFGKIQMYWEKAYLPHNTVFTRTKGYTIESYLTIPENIAQEIIDVYEKWEASALESFTGEECGGYYFSNEETTSSMQNHEDLLKEYICKYCIVDVSRRGPVNEEIESLFKLLVTGLKAI